jgi:hypothetical protein
MRRLLAAGVTWDPGLKPSVEGVAMAVRRREGDWVPWRSGVNWDDMTMGKFWGNPEVGLSSVEKGDRSARKNLAGVQKCDRRSGCLTVGSSRKLKSEMPPPM